MNEYRQQQLRAPDLYRYHSITYTYDELRKAHRRQQLAIQAAIDCGDYNAACEAANLDTREFLPQIAKQQTGDKRTLTPRRKCGIIKAITRHVNRWKQKQEGKIMKAYYYENNGYNGILLTLGKRFISYDERIDGIDINRENIAKIVQNFTEYGLDDHDFETMWGQNLGTLIHGENAKKCLAEQDYTELIYKS